MPLCSTTIYKNNKKSENNVLHLFQIYTNLFTLCILINKYFKISNQHGKAWHLLNQNT
jgi:hypothetical protein